MCSSDLLKGGGHQQEVGTCINAVGESLAITDIGANSAFIAVFAFDEGNTFEALFSNVNMYMSAMFAILIFAIIISYLFGREYSEHTLKTMLTIPISRGKFLLSKYLMFLVWIVILTIATSLSTLILKIL